MDNDSSISNCTDVENTYLLQGIMGSVGAVVCMLALVTVLGCRFYRDIVQRLILYKLIVMTTFSVALLLLLVDYDHSLYLLIVKGVVATTYFSNLILTFWLSVVLFMCIVCLKELRSLQKLEPIMLISSLLGLLVYIYDIVFFKFDDDCTLTWIVHSSHPDVVNDATIFFSVFFGIIYLLIVVMLVTILLKVCIQSRYCCTKKDEDGYLLLTTNNKWKRLLKQLLPVIVYPIISIILFYSYYIAENTKFFNYSFLLILYSVTGLATGSVVIVHLLLLKCKKSTRQKDSQEDSCVMSNHSEVFTKETVASTNARTTYEFTRSSNLVSS